MLFYKLFDILSCILYESKENEGRMKEEWRICIELLEIVKNNLMKER